MLQDTQSDSNALALNIIASEGTWDYIYMLDGTSYDNPACKLSGEIVLPLGKAVRFELSSLDSIHQWSLPELNIKADAVPGRMQNLRCKAALSAP